MLARTALAMNERRARVWSRFASFYRGLALFVLNTLVLIVLAHAATWAWYTVRPPSDSGSARVKFLGASAALLHPGRSPEELRVLFNETWWRPVEYQPFAEFKERPFRGRFVNVSDEGYRLVRNQGPWPPTRDHFNVFAFGGSTTFGYGIADDETIASFLQDELGNRTPRPPRVYNFGCGYHYSSQERARFQQLLVGGFIPDAAVFVQGLNEFHTYKEWPALSTAVHGFVEQRATRTLSRFPRWLTLFSPDRIRAELRPYRRSEWTRDNTPSSDPRLADRLIDRYLANKKMIEAVGTAFGVQPVFVWQPVMLHGFDTKRFPNPRRPQPLTGIGTARMAERLKHARPPRNFIWAADIQGEVPDPLYVDPVHYAPNLCRAIARLTATEMDQRGFLTASARSSQASALDARGR